MSNSCKKAKVKVDLSEKYVRKMKTSKSLTKKKWCRNKVTKYIRQAKRICGPTSDFV